jgi:WD40 repeat protein
VGVIAVAQGPELEEQTNSSLIGVVQASFGGNGNWLAVAENQRIVIYDLKGGRVSRQIPVAKKAALAAHPSADLLAISDGTSLSLYDLPSGRVLWRTILQVPCGSIRFSFDGSKLLGICGSDTAPPLGEIGDGHLTLELWNVGDGSTLARPPLPDDLVVSGLFSNDGRWVVCAKKLDTQSGDVPGTPRTVSGQMKAPHNDAIIDLQTGQVVGNVEGLVVYEVSTRTHTALVEKVNTGQTLLVDITTGNTIFAFKDLDLPLFVQVSLDGSYFLVIDRGGSASIVNAATGHVMHPGWRIRAVSGMLAFAYATAITADGTQVAFATSFGVTLYKVSRPEEVRIIGVPQLLDQLLPTQNLDDESTQMEEKGKGTKGDSKRMQATMAAQEGPEAVCAEQTYRIRNRKHRDEANIACLQKADPAYGDCLAQAETIKGLEARTRAQNVCDAEWDTTQETRAQAKRGLFSKFGGPQGFPPVTAYFDSGRLLAVLTADFSWGLWDTATGNRLSYHKPFFPIHAESIQDLSASLRDGSKSVEKEFGVSAQGDSRFASTSSNVAGVPSADGLSIFTFFPHAARYIYDPWGPLLDAGVHVSDAASGKHLFDLPDALTAFGFPAVLPQGKVIIGPEKGNTVGIWNRNTGEQLGTLYALQEGEWLLTTPSGFFDGSPRGWTKIAWRLPNDISTLPCEAFFNEFFRPGLLAELLDGHAPKPPRDMAQIDRRQAIVSLSSDSLIIEKKVATVHIQVAEAASGAGLRDVRLFRNGTLVKTWRGDLPLNNGRSQLDADVPLVAGDNRFVAYAFNRDNVKSEDAVLNIRRAAPAQKGTAYILAIGVNRYSNPEFDLRFAVPDAQYLAQTLSETETNLGDYRNVIAVNLLDQEATRANILLALSILAGRASTDFPPDTPAQLASLKPSQPEDMVAVYFAGHGLAWDDHFYMIPYDLGYSGPRQNLSQSLQSVLRSSISDVDLERAFEPLDAAHILLIIDACNSGKLLDAEDQRRGPMNSKGLAQLAYEKGIYVLTAAQAYQAALESEKVGHGYLTYALAEEGLKTPIADTRPKDGQISVAEWFEYASQRVPQIQNETLSQPRNFVFELDQSGNAPHDRLQTPRLYYRRDQPGGEAIVARIK